MGCGGSKEDVAAGNAVSRRSLFRAKSDASKRKASSAAFTSSASSKSLASDAAPVVEGGVKPVAQQLGDIINVESNKEPLSAATTVVKLVATSAGDEKRVSHESLDQYYSPRKDEEVASTGTAGEGAEYFSPAYEHGCNAAAEASAEVEKLAEVSRETDGGDVPEPITVALTVKEVDEKPQAGEESKAEDEGKPTDKDADLKDKLVVEEEKTNEVDVTNKEKIGDQ